MTVEMRREIDSFIIPREAPNGKFRCAVCGSANLRIDYDPRTLLLVISCEQCGNFAALNLALEEANGRV